MANNTYNANTNWANQEKYLNNLISSGSAGNKAWAQNELTKLNEAKQQYGGTTNTSGSSVPTSTGSVGTNTSSTYNIGSTAGIQAAKDLAVGGSYTAGDGSTWTKGSDGNITVNKNGNTYQGVLDYNKVDYQDEINKAVGTGNYSLASQLETQRNDKIDWLNSTNSNIGNYEKSNLYGNYNTLLDVPEDWTSAVVGGNKYTRDETGKMYNEAGTYLGDGYNPITNEFTYSGTADAYNAMLSALKGEHGLAEYSDADAIAYLQSQGLWNTDLYNAYKNGTLSEYQKALKEKQKQEQEIKQAIAEIQSARDQVNAMVQNSQQYVNNWLEDITTPTTSTSSGTDSRANYLNTISKSQLKNKIY